jgi:biopolymer transport protein ExbB/TolQ
MQLFQMLGEASIVARLSLLVAIFPIGAGLAYALRPSEQRLALVRPVSLAGLFAGLAGTVAGLINVLSATWRAENIPWRVISVGAAEALVTLFVAFGCLTVTWLCVAIGFQRMSRRDTAAD